MMKLISLRSSALSKHLHRNAIIAIIFLQCILVMYNIFDLALLHHYHTYHWSIHGTSLAMSALVLHHYLYSVIQGHWKNSNQNGVLVVLLAAVQISHLIALLNQSIDWYLSSALFFIVLGCIYLLAQLTHYTSHTFWLSSALAFTGSIGYIALFCGWIPSHSDWLAIPLAAMIVVVKELSRLIFGQRKQA